MTVEKLIKDKLSRMYDGERLWNERAERGVEKVSGVFGSFYRLYGKYVESSSGYTIDEAVEWLLD